jgi:hypothetical protein
LALDGTLDLIVRTERLTSGGLLAAASGIAAQTVFALAATPLANPGATTQANALATPPYDQALTQSLQFVGLALAVLTLIIVGVVVARIGAGAGAAALFALPVTPVAFFATVFLEEQLFPQAYWFFLAPAGWYSRGVWAIATIALPVFMAIAAGVAAAAAVVTRRLARRAVTSPRSG